MQTRSPERIAWEDYLENRAVSPNPNEFPITSPLALRWKLERDLEVLDALFPSLPENDEYSQQFDDFSLSMEHAIEESVQFGSTFMGCGKLASEFLLDFYEYDPLVTKDAINKLSELLYQEAPSL